MTDLSDPPQQDPANLTRSITLGGCATVGFAALLALIWHSATTLFLLFAGILFGVFLNALSELLRKLVGGPRTLRLSIVSVLLTVMFTGVVVLGGATIADQAAALSSTIKSQIANVKGFLDQRGVDSSFLDLGALTVSDTATNVQHNLPSADAIASSTSTILGQTLKVLLAIFGTLGNVFIVLFLGVLLAAQPGVYRSGGLALIPISRRSRAATVIDEIGETLRRWLLGQIVTMSTIFVVVWMGLTIIGIPGALVLGFQAGLLTFIPTVGAVIAGLLIVLASLGSGLTAVISSFVLYLVVQFLEGNILTPLIQRHAIDIPPATIFGAQILLGVLFGLWGIALALPLTAIAKALLRHLLETEASQIRTAP